MSQKSEHFPKIWKFAENLKMVRSCLTLITCLKGHKSLRVRFGSVFQKCGSVSDKGTYRAVWEQLKKHQYQPRAPKQNSPENKISHNFCGADHLHHSPVDPRGRNRTIFQACRPSHTHTERGKSGQLWHCLLSQTYQWFDQLFQRMITNYTHTGERQDWLIVTLQCIVFAHKPDIDDQWL